MMDSGALLRSASDLPDHEVRRLLEAATGRHWSALLLGADLTTGEVEVFHGFVERRRSGEPLQYIEGTVPFGPIEVAVDPRVLVPRPETEQLVERAIEFLRTRPAPQYVLDLCTGSGCIAIAIAIAEGCEGCIASHARAAARKGVSLEQVAEMIGVSIQMQGGPATVYGPKAWEAFKEFEERY